MSTESLIGEQVECFTKDGATWGVGQVYGYTDDPYSVMVERADGTRFSWRRDLTRVAPKPIAPKPSDLRDYIEHPGNWGTLDGRRGLLLAMLDALETSHEADTAHDVALERAAVLRVLSGDLEWAIKVDASERGYIERLIAFIESGDHWKDGA